MLKKRMPRRIFDHKRDHVTADCRTTYSDELHNLLPSPDVNPVIKSRKIR